MDVNDKYPEYRQITGLDRGEVCNFRVKATCGAPGFTLTPGGSWTSSQSQFNTTWVEFEGDALHNAVEMGANTTDVNVWMPSLDSRFIYNFYTVFDYWLNSYSGV